METEKIKHLEKINELLSIREAKKDSLMEIDRLIMKVLPLLDSMPIRWYVRNNGQDEFESVIKYLKNKHNRENLPISINCGVGELHGELCFVPHDVQYSFEITQNEFNYLMNETCFYYKIDDNPDVYDLPTMDEVLEYLESASDEEPSEEVLDDLIIQYLEEEGLMFDFC